MAIGIPKELDARDQKANILCRACRYSMPINALKCTKCSSWQDWRRFLNTSNTFLSLLVALVSVLTFAVPVWKETLIPDNTLPAPVLVEVDFSGKATFVVTNEGNRPSIIEHVIVGSDEVVVSFDLSALSERERVIEKRSLSMFQARLSVENDIDSVWSLVQLFRSEAGCVIQAGIISPNGERRRANVNISHSGLDGPTTGDGCPLKVRKLIVVTIKHLAELPEYEKTICEVSKLHPRDPLNPKVGTRCEQFVDIE